jgi:hypothetical protein
MVFLNAVSFKARTWFVATLIVLSLSAPSFGANTYYVSKSSGADTNSSTQAMSKSTPWAHLPGMATCGNNCASYTPVAGDKFILMGCDVWVSADLPVSWNWSGSSGNPITITVDKTWYNTTNCPSSWNRPILNNASHTIYSPNTLFNVASTGATSWIVIDNIEFKGLACTGNCSGMTVGIWCYNSCSNTTFSNDYLHAWNIVTDGSCMMVGFGAGSVPNTVDRAVIDGSDATGASPAGATCNAFFGPLPNVTNSVIHDLPNAIVGYVVSGNTLTISGNLIYNIGNSNAGSHPNFIETLPSLPSGNGTYLIYSNVLHDEVGAGVETMMIQNPTETDYVWNNVMWNIGNAPTLGQIGNIVGTAAYFYNNTIVPNSGSSCFYQNGGNAVPTLVIANTHCITSGLLVSGITGSPTLTTNVVMNPTVATSQGYVPSETYAYSPTSSSNSTVGAGTDFTSTANGRLASLSNDTYYACSLQAIDGVVQSVCPTRSVIARGASWAVGAYQYGNTPAPPSALTAVVQ